MNLPGPYTRTGVFLYAVPLFAGPVLAGLSRAPAATLPVFAAAFGLLALKGRLPDLTTGRGWAALTVLLLVQIGLVSLIYGLGQLLAWPFGALWLPVWLPLILSLTAAAYALWRYRGAADLDAMLDEALARIRSGPNRRAAKDLRHPDTMEAVPAFVARLSDHSDPRPALSGLLAEMGAGDEAADLAAMLYLAHPPARAAVFADDRLGRAVTLGLTSSDERVRRAAQHLARTLIAENAGCGAFPPGDRIAHIAATVPDTADTLAAIAAHLEDQP